MSHAEAHHLDQPAIPVIDLRDLPAGAHTMQAIGRQMLEAAERFGFFYISHHGIPQPLIDSVLHIAATFFVQPPEQKLSVAVNAGHRGFIQMSQAKMASLARPDLKESFIWGLDSPGDDGIPPNRWPRFLPAMQPVLTEFFQRGNQLGWLMLRTLATAIGCPADTFVRTIDRPISRGSIIYYPPPGWRGRGSATK